MTRTTILTLITLLTVSTVFGQIQPVDVAELTLKVGALKTEYLYYGFAEGDQIVFDFEVVKGKGLKEIEIIELPSNSKFMDYKSSLIQDKKIQVHKKAVYQFKFYNSSMAGRICKVRIQRIPKSEDLLTFNTNWEWKTLYDTTYVPYTEDSIVGYDTTYKTVYRKELTKDELALEDIIVNNGVKVHSLTYNWAPFCECRGDYNQTITSVDLPAETKENLKRVENVAWVYGVGVDQTLKKKAEQTRKDVLKAGKTISTLLAQPELAVVFSLASSVSSSSAEDIYYAIFKDYQNANLFNRDLPGSKVIKQDEIVSAGSVKMTYPLTGRMYFGFSNNNETRGITVYLNVSVWRRYREWTNVEEQKQVVTPRTVTLNKTRMVVKTRKIRINAD